MQFTFEQYQQSADYLRGQIGTFTPKVLLILGSGLGYLANEVENPIAVSYGDIPHFMTSTAPWSCRPSGLRSAGRAGCGHDAGAVPPL